MEILLLIIRIVLAAIFAVAGIGKLLDLKGAEKASKDFGVPESLAKFFAVLLPVVEIIIAIGLIFVPSAWLAAIGAGGLLTIFVGGMIVQMVKGNAPDCHCFGQIHSEPVGAKSLIRNLIFLLLAVVLIVSGRENQGADLFQTKDFADNNVMQIILGLAVVALLAAVVYFLKKISEQQIQIMRRIEVIELTAAEGGKVVERENLPTENTGLLIGTTAPEFALPDSSGKNVSLENLLQPRQPILFFFVSPNCQPCAKLLPEIEAWRENLKNKVEFVFVSSGKAEENLEKFGGDGQKILLQKDREVGEKFGALWTPTAVLINADGAIASRAAVGDAAIRRLVGQIESADDEISFISNGNQKIGATIPEFSFKDAAGNQTTAENLRGKKTLLTYWSLSCGFCDKMLEDLRDWDATKNQDAPNLFLLSSGDAEAHRKLNFVSPIILDDENKYAEAVGLEGTPSAILIDENGRIISETARGADEIWSLLSQKK